MSASGSSSVPTAKMQPKDSALAQDAPAVEPKKQASLEEDDEFEDFPVEDWTAEEAEVPGGNAHLWEDSWDDDDTSEEFSKQLKEEMEKMKKGE